MTDPARDNSKDEPLAIPTSISNKDLFFNASVAELRRKAQEHSEALLKNIQSQQHKNGETTSPKSDVGKKSLNDSVQSMSDAGIFNGKIFPKSSLDLDKNLNGSLMQHNSLPGGIPPIDFPKFPPPNYLSALSNFGLHGFPNLPDFNTSPPGIHPKFASDLATLIDKSSGDVNLKNINNITESGLTDTKNLSPGHLDESQNESPDSKFKPTTINLNAKADCSKLDV